MGPEGSEIGSSEVPNGVPDRVLGRRVCRYAKYGNMDILYGQYALYEALADTAYCTISQYWHIWPNPPNRCPKGSQNGSQRVPNRVLRGLLTDPERSPEES